MRGVKVSTPLSGEKSPVRGVEECCGLGICTLINVTVQVQATQQLLKGGGSGSVVIVAVLSPLLLAQLHGTARSMITDTISLRYLNN